MHRCSYLLLWVTKIRLQSLQSFGGNSFSSTFMEHSLIRCFIIWKSYPLRIWPQPKSHLNLNPFNKLSNYLDGATNTFWSCRSQNGHLLSQLFAHSRHMIWFWQLRHCDTLESNVSKFVHTTHYINRIRASAFWRLCPTTSLFLTSAASPSWLLSDETSDNRKAFFIARKLFFSSIRVWSKPLFKNISYIKCLIIINWLISINQKSIKSIGNSYKKVELSIKFGLFS